MKNGRPEPSHFTPQDWHARFQAQARWTAYLRDYLFSRLPPGPLQRILEVGSGTGAITADLHQRLPAGIYGLDLSQDFLALARSIDPSSKFTRGMAHHLPFGRGAFDITLCHYLLLWLDDPLGALLEMQRVTRPGGAVLALADTGLDVPEQVAVDGAFRCFHRVKATVS